MSRTTRLFVHDPLAPGQQRVIDGEAAAHLGRVLRARPGEPITLFDGSGPEFGGQIVEIGRRTLTVRVGTPRTTQRGSPLRLVLLQGLCRNDRMDWVVRKATELGVTAIQPVMAARSVVRLEPKKMAGRVEHWRAIAISACEQCGRNDLPDLLPPLPVDTALSAHAGSAGVLLDPDADSGLEKLPQPSGPLCLLVGPEGGLDQRERAAAQDCGYFSVRLGPRILRTETAALVGLTLLQARFGDLG